MSPTRQLQTVLIGFFAVSLFALLAIAVVQPSIYVASGQSMGLPLLLLPVLLFVALLIIGTLRLWRWVFWLILAAFALSALRVPLFGLQLLGLMPLEHPLWYAWLRTLISAGQFPIALWMFSRYRSSGVWGQERTAGRRQG